MTTHALRTQAHTCPHKGTVLAVTKECCCDVEDSIEGIKAIGLMLYSGRDGATVWPLLYGSCPMRPSLTYERKKKSARCQMARCKRYNVRRMLLTCVAAAALLPPGLHSETGDSMVLALWILPVRAFSPFSTALSISGKNTWN